MKRAMRQHGSFRKGIQENENDMVVSK